MEEQHSMIELQGIIKRFYIGQPNELEILHGIDLKVNRGTLEQHFIRLAKGA